jgi:hypothetical protein
MFDAHPRLPHGGCEGAQRRARLQQW